MRTTKLHQHGGFTLLEVAAAAAVLAVIVGLLIPAAQHVRRMGHIGEDLSHFRTIAGLTTSYAADNQDLVWGYSWQSGVAPQTPYPDLNYAPASDLEAGQLQFTYLMRAVAGREEMPIVQNLFPYSQNSHLVLAQYAGIPLPNRLFTAAGGHRQRWADDPAGYDQGLYTPNLGVGGQNIRQPYASDFTVGSCWYDWSPPGTRVYPSSTSILIIYPTADLRPKAWSQVAHPSQKAFLHDRIARHFGPRVAWHTMLEAKLPVLMADGSARVRDFGREANSGADPNNNVNSSVNYYPTAIEPPVGGPNQFQCRMGPMWTKAGLAGRDFGGPEVSP